MRWFAHWIMTHRQVIAFFALLLLFPYGVYSAVPKLINYQGSLADASGKPVPDGTYQIKFKIYGSPLGIDSLWWNGFRDIAITNGNFSYLLGSHERLPIHLFDGDTIRYLGITVGSDPELVPRTRLVTVPYSYQTLHADSSDYAVTVPDYSISTAKLMDNAVTGSKISNGTISDVDINATAEINPSKIDGTAMVLSSSSWQTVSGFVEFTGPVYMYDSVFRSSQYGVKIGSAVAHSPDGGLLEITRNYNSTGVKYGEKVTLNNASSGSLTAIRTEVEHTTPGSGASATAVYGLATSDGSARSGLYGVAQAQNSAITTGNSYGVSGAAYDGANAYGVYGYAASATTNYAGYFNGNLHVTGTLSKGGGSFKIDHPLEPENKYLQHSFVESPDMMNIYNGNVQLDAGGEAQIDLPEWFDALNREFRYQLTAIGAPGPNLYISEEIRDNHFRIAGGKSGMTVSWQVTGVRKDPWAEANRIQVEVLKNPDEQGKYMHPEVYKQPVEKSVDYESLRLIHQERTD